MSLEIDYARTALDSIKPHLSLLPIDVQQKIRIAAHVIEHNAFPNPESLARELGGKPWVIARRTGAIVQRYGESVICVTSKQYDRAVRSCLESLT